jgi:sulfatase maturation enzyme AslB (radical SAM superfamily)
MPKITKEYIEFYITNVCNFNCDNCNRLNNYYFYGHDLWEDQAETYRQWSDKIDFKEIKILGGEPTLNPSLDQWISGTRALWPNAKMILLTNGSRLKYMYQRNFFDLLAKTNTELHITLHNRDRYQIVIDEIKQYLTDPVERLIPAENCEWQTAYDNVKDPSWPECQTYEDFELLPDNIKKECIEIHKIGIEEFKKVTGALSLSDSTGIKILIEHAEVFVTAPLKYAGKNKFSVYDSDPKEAHRVCISRDCTHLIKGKMYKCHHVALLPEFAQQYHVDMTPQQTKLMSSYQPLTVDADHNSTIAFLDRIKRGIPQCQLCPSELEPVYLKSSTTKPKIKKKVIDITPISL